VSGAGAALVASAADASGFPRGGPPEVALLGRSNVGKSSLLNRLVGHARLARVSSTPGKTRLIHFYRVERGGRALLLVDLPGYGFAKVSRAERERWKALVESYLDARRALRLAVLLLDVRRDPGEDESLLVAWLAERQVPVCVALTKIDKERPMRREQRVAVLRGGGLVPADRVVATSARSGDGIAALWRAIERAVT
jgi:GTP-binding protein